MRFKSGKQLAKFAIEYFLFNQKLPLIKEREVPKYLIKKGACFVTVYLGNKLKGCVGDYIVDKPLYLGIIKSAINAAFFDYRFTPVKNENLTDINIKVSVLTPLKKFCPQNINQLKQFLETKRPGLLIGAGDKKALFLPPVWCQLKTADEFLTHLCLKAGLPCYYWQNNKLNFWVFYTK